MSYIVCDVESDGPIIGKNSMVCFGAVIVREGLKDTFYGKTKPISNNYNPEALAVSGFTREEHLLFDKPQEVMWNFKEWIKEKSTGAPILISDNNGYDASWINWYFLTYLGVNPFGWSSRRIGDMFCGFYNNSRYQWKKHRNSDKYPHNHDPISDACGNATALMFLKEQSFKIKFD